MAKFEFPRNPDKDRDNPFRDDRGINPFADRASEAPAEANPFAAPSTGAKPPDENEYETQLHDRAGIVRVSGIIGFSLAVTGLLALASSVAATGSWELGILYCLPIQCVSLAVAMPAWLMGGKDLQAMAAGAMVSTRLRQTRVGRLLGGAAVLMSVIPVLVFVVRLLSGLLAGI